MGSLWARPTDDKSSLELDNLTNKDLIIEILQRTSNKGMSDSKLRKILEYVPPWKAVRAAPVDCSVLFGVAGL